MRILVAFDKFKHFLTAEKACRIAAEAVRDEKKDWLVEMVPLTDGGERFCQILTSSREGNIMKIPVFDPNFRKIEAEIGMVDLSVLEEDLKTCLKLPAKGKIAIVEMAQASGLERLEMGERNPWRASSFGTGELLARAAREGADAILLGVGGSATNDLGLGALEALGLEFIGQDKKPITQITPAKWKQVSDFSGKILENLPPIYIACDVANPLLGTNGAAAVFGPQKGLKKDDLERMDSEMDVLAGHLCRFLNKPLDLKSEPGSGAAGGISFGLRAACNARICPGFDLVSRWLRLEKKISRSDLVLTGEGRFDRSSLGGKAPGGLLAMAGKNGKPVKVFAGSVEEKLEQFLPPGVKQNDLIAISRPDWSPQTPHMQNERSLYEAIRANLSRLR